MRLPLGLAIAAAVGCGATQGQGGPAYPFRAVVGPAIIAHRGGSLEVPENTRSAVEHGFAVGADWVEIDVLLSKDGEVVVLHEDELRRLAGAEGRASEMTLEELAKLDVGAPSWAAEKVAYLRDNHGVAVPDFAGRFPGERIPTLREVLAIDGRFMIEMKAAGGDAQRLADGVLEAIRETNAYGRIVVGSFDPRLLDALALRDPSIALVGILDDEAMLNEMVNRGVAIVAVSPELAEVALTTVPEGTAVWVWTVYTPEMADELATLGVHGLITDIPAKLVEYIRAEKPVRLELSD